MSNIIDSIQLSGVTYTIQGTGGGGITSGEVQTMIAEAVSGKADVSAATIVNQTSGTVTSAKSESHSVALDFSTAFTYNDGVVSFSGAIRGLIVEYHTMKYTTIDGVEYTVTTAGDTDDYTFSYGTSAGKIVATMKGSNRLTYISVKYELDVNPTFNYTYSYIKNESVAASTFIEDEINPKIETIETSLSGKQDTLSAGTGIQISGNVISATGGGGGNPTVELTQAQYDALVTAGTVSADTYYIITDAQAGDLTQYWTSAQTNSAITEATSGKADTTAVTQSITEATSGKVDSNVYTAYTAATDTALASKADTATTYTKTEVDTALSGYVTTDTLQDITAQKTFVGDPNNNKKSIKFKQYDNTSKVGFVVVNSAATNNEVASFEFRPNTFTIDNVQHPLLYFGHYRNTNIANAGVPQTVIGFRQYDQKNAAAYHYLIPLPEEAKTPFSLTTSFKDYYAPIGFKNGSTMITANDAGVVDLSSVFGGKADTTAVTQSITEATSGKVDSSTYTAYTASTDTAIQGKQDTLVSGTNIKTINNQSILGSGNIDIQGGGGGKAVSGGTNISITTGETADTINCTLPISADTRQNGTNLILFNYQNTINHNNTTGNFIVGNYNTFGNYFDQAQKNIVFGNTNTLEGYYQGRGCLNNFVVGNNNFFGSMSSGYAVSNTAVFGQYNNPKNDYEFVFGQYNNSVSASTTFGDSGNTLFSVGNGTSTSARHNAFEIRQNGDIYITLDGQDVKLQDRLGGGTVSSAITSGDTNAVAGGAVYDKFDEVEQVTARALNSLYDSLSGKVGTSAVTSSMTSSSTDAEIPSAKCVYDTLGGLKLVKLTQSAYDALSPNYDNNTLYVIVN